jgi:hypothetical protein
MIAVLEGEEEDSRDELPVNMLPVVTEPVVEEKV